MAFDFAAGQTVSEVVAFDDRTSTMLITKGALTRIDVVFLTNPLVLAGPPSAARLAKGTSGPDSAVIAQHRARVPQHAGWANVPDGRGPCS